MDKLRIKGGHQLNGTIAISGAKNAMLPLMAASLLTDQSLVLNNAPCLEDVRSLLKLLTQLGVAYDDTHWSGQKQITLSAHTLTSHTAPYDLVRKMRASILVLGPLLARHGIAEVSLPGGCAIGVRPVNFHILGLEAMGATITIDGGYIKAHAPQGLQGCTFKFPIVSVTGTENLMMAATLAQGTTRLENAACEPEITNLAECLVKMGARIKGIGTSCLEIMGVDRLHGTTHTVLPDRIETGSYIMAVGLTGGAVTLTNTALSLLSGVDEILSQAGIKLTAVRNGIHVQCDPNDLQAQDVVIAPYPGFPTDLQAQFVTLMTQARGTSHITETIWENRFMHVPELIRMGAHIDINGNTLTVQGKTQLRGAQVMATDLRASKSLVMAGLAAQGETTVNRIYHLDRGYENLESKLRACGADVTRVSDDFQNMDYDTEPKEKL